MNPAIKIPESFLLILLGAGFFACSPDSIDDTYKPDKPETLRYYQPFKQSSVFYNRIPQNHAIDPNSAVMVSGLVEQADKSFLIVVKEWSVPVYFASDSTPKHSVKLTAGWAPKSKLRDVPIPGFAEPDPEYDGSMVIIDESSGCVYDFWQMRFSGGSWSASWGNALPLNSDGIFPKGVSARGSGFELLQGVIWPQELQAGVIEHALIFSYDHTKAGGPVAPATESDGTTTEAWAIPEGALVQLDPSLDLASMGLTGYELTIARALQEYGMYCADDGGGLSLYAINPISCRQNPYESIWGDQTYIFLNKIPADKLRVLLLPPQADIDPEVVPNSCANFE